MIEKLRGALQEYWGYDTFLPYQEEAMEAVMHGRDSVVVLPTGGGKSLCFQAPAVMMDGMAVVVSPLIALMKDQVDTLTEMGIPAERIDSTLSQAQHKAVIPQIHDGTLKLLYVSPERLNSSGFRDLLSKAKLSFIAIDEAHCISLWGHEFRPDYRELGRLKETYPGVTIHAYTATATERVRGDIAEQLRLDNPQMLVGSYDRPNLIYRVRRKTNILHQIIAVCHRHQGESGIIYCIRRADVDKLGAQLSERGYSARPYHAGMAHDDRRQNQEAFSQEKIDIIVATVAFGMGIDKSNVRYVIHAGLPKSIEHYQQESGRAGRDGLEAECILFYSGGDYGAWQTIFRDQEQEAKEISLGKLKEIYSYATGITCRHEALVSYFGQSLDSNNCAACDVCLAELNLMEEPLEVSQKILSCLMRLGQRFGADYTASVLVASRNQRILQNGHDKLSTYGLLSDFRKRSARDWIEQLVAQGYIQKLGEYNVLIVTETGRRILNGEEIPRLLEPAKRPARESRVAKESWADVDRELFEALRSLRREIAHKKGVPPYIVFDDAALRDMARRKPTTTEDFLNVHGVGQMKREQYGAEFLAAINKYCLANTIEMDIEHRVGATDHRVQERMSEDRPKLSSARQLAFGLFAQGHSVEEVAQAANRATSTTLQYLIEYIQTEKIQNPYPWVDRKTLTRVEIALQETGSGGPKSVFDFLDSEIPYGHIRISLAILRNSPHQNIGT